ncbi:hypothetical protein LXL04_001531 [Taraxacum kok-saghyz]
MAVAKMIQEEQVARLSEFRDVNGGDFEFSLVLSDEEGTVEQNDAQGWTVFPVFNRDLLVTNEEDREAEAKADEIDVSSTVIAPLRKLFMDEREESSLCSSSESDELESPRIFLRRSNSEGKDPVGLLTLKKVDSP